MSLEIKNILKDFGTGFRYGGLQYMWNKDSQDKLLYDKENENELAKILGNDARAFVDGLGIGLFVVGCYCEHMWIHNRMGIVSKDGSEMRFKDFTSKRL